MKLFAASPVDITGISLTQDYRVDLSRPTEVRIKHMKREITWMTVEIEQIPDERQKEETPVPEDTAEAEAGTE